MGPRNPGAPLAALLVLLLTACGGGEEVFDSGVEPVRLTLPAPTYAAATPDGLLVRSGDAERVFPRAASATFLPDGRALVSSDEFTRVWDPETGELGERLPFIDAKRTVSGITAIEPRDPRPYRLTMYAVTPDAVEKRWTVDLPLQQRYPDNWDGYIRDYQAGHVVGGVAFLMWSDSAHWAEDGDYGVLRVSADGRDLDNHFVKGSIVSTWLSADGSALLALRRLHGRQPCGGCVVHKELVELDPATGEVAAEYGMPEEYDKTWSVTAVDKVGDRVAVRFEDSVSTGPDREGDYATRLEQRGTWVYDGDAWSMVPGSEEELVWWQGEDRIVLTPDPRRSTTDGRLAWVHDGARTPLPGRLYRCGRQRCVQGSVPGTLIRP